MSAKVGDIYVSGRHVADINNQALCYLDNRYNNFLGYQGMVHYVHKFPKYRKRIEQYVMKDMKLENPGVDNGYYVFPGLNRMPFNIIGFIDNTMDKFSVPHSGQRGDYIGAARKVNYDDAQ